MFFVLFFSSLQIVISLCDVPQPHAQICHRIHADACRHDVQCLVPHRSRWGRCNRLLPIFRRPPDCGRKVGERRTDPENTTEAVGKYSPDFINTSPLAMAPLAYICKWFLLSVGGGNTPFFNEWSSPPPPPHG